MPRVTDLPSDLVGDDTDVVLVVDSADNTTKQITVANLLASRLRITGGTMSGPLVVAADSTAAIQVQSVGGTGILYVDTINQRVGFGIASPQAQISLGTNVANVKLALYDGGTEATQGGIGWQAGLFRLKLYDGPGQRYGFFGGATGSSIELFTIVSTGQVGINTSVPATTAILDIVSTTQGVLLPRMTTTQRDAIVSPPVGLVIFNSTTSKLNVRGAAAWEAVTSV